MDELKERLEKLIRTKKLTDPEVINLSQQLDKLMNADGGVLKLQSNLKDLGLS